jgi:hypothetical protein
VTAPQLCPEWQCGRPRCSPITGKATLELFYSSTPCFLSLPTLRQSLTVTTSSSAPPSNPLSKHSQRRFDLPSSFPSPAALYGVHPVSPRAIFQRTDPSGLTQRRGRYFRVTIAVDQPSYSYIYAAWTLIGAKTLSLSTSTIGPSRPRLDQTRPAETSRATYLLV